MMPFRRSSWLISLFYLVVCGTGCKKNNDIVLFKMEYDQLINIPAGLNTLETYSFLLKDLPTNYTNLLSTFNVAPEAVLFIKPGPIRLSDNLNQLEFARVERISLLASMAGFAGEKEIGYMEPVPLNAGQSLQLFPTLSDATDIFKSNVFNLKLKIKLRSFLTSSSNIRLKITMNAVGE